MSTDEHAAVEVLTERIGHLIERLDRFEKSAETRYVTVDQFGPVQRLVYGGIGIVLTAVLVAGLTAVIIKH